MNDMKSQRESRICLVCGIEFMARTSPSRAAKGSFCSKSCAAKHRNTRHSHTTKTTTSPTYNTWVNMISRCHKPSAPNFDRYGGRGIEVCDEWRNSFDAFLRDMGERPEGTTIDRIDSDAGYDKANCRWRSAKEQQRNIRSNKIITFNGESGCIAWWAEKLGVPHATLTYRLKHWDLARALKPAKLIPPSSA